MKQSVPWKHRHLLDNIPSSDWEDMMEVMNKKFGTKTIVVDNIVDEIEKMKTISTDGYFVEFVEKLERIERDLTGMGLESEIENSTILGKLESKLPPVIKKDWIDLIIKEDLNDETSKAKFKKFMEFLVRSRRGVEYQMSDARVATGKNQSSLCYVTGKTLTTRANVTGGGGERSYRPCLACGDSSGNKSDHLMDRCDLWNSLSQREKEDKVKCKKHIFAKDHDTSTCKREIRPCKFCQKTNHHFLLCSKYRKSGSCTAAASVAMKKKNNKTNNNSNSVENNNETEHSNSNTKKSKFPRHVLAMFVEGSQGESYGTVFDNCSTDNYVTNEVAETNNLKVVDEVELIVEGIGTQRTEVKTKVFAVPIKDKYGNIHTLECYGLDQIAPDIASPENKTYQKLCQKFGLDHQKLKRPKHVQLLISLDNVHLLLDKKRCIGNMALFEGPLGLVLGGSDPGLRQSNLSSLRLQATTHAVTMRALITHVTQENELMSSKKLLQFFQEENIGVNCNPQCGNCRCGKCALGAKQMTLKDEKEYDLFLSHMEHDKEGTNEDPGPYWRVKYPWIVPKEDLPDNITAVRGVMNATAKKLSKDPTWRGVYESQLKDLISNEFAREVTERELTDWIKSGGKTYSMSHLVALNPASKSTPVRVVFNNSRKFKGYSLNSSWPLGPDIMNSLHGILVRFREEVVGAQGDIKKMYYMVRIEKEEQMMQLFMWRFEGEERTRTFCMTRLVMGNKPSSNFSQIAVKETTELEDYPVRYPLAHKALNRNSYVDNVLVASPNKVTLDKNIEEI